LAVGAAGASFFPQLGLSPRPPCWSPVAAPSSAITPCLRCSNLAHGCWHRWRRIRPNACFPIAVFAALLRWLGRLWAGSAAAPADHTGLSARSVTVRTEISQCCQPPP